MAKNAQKQKEMNSSLSIKIPSEMLDKARAKSKQTGVTLSFVVRKAIEDWLANGTKKQSK